MSWITKAFRFFLLRLTTIRNCRHPEYCSGDSACMYCKGE